MANLLVLSGYLGHLPNIRVVFGIKSTKMCVFRQKNGVFYTLLWCVLHPPLVVAKWPKVAKMDTFSGSIWPKCVQKWTKSHHFWSGSQWDVKKYHFILYFLASPVSVCRPLDFKRGSKIVHARFRQNVENYVRFVDICGENHQNNTFLVIK